MNLPGYDFAKQWGYSLSSYSSARDSATYVKDFEECTIFLTVNIRGQGKLERTIGLIGCTVEIGIPHPKFSMFENQLVSLASSILTIVQQ